MNHLHRVFATEILKISEDVSDNSANESVDSPEIPSESIFSDVAPPVPDVAPELPPAASTGTLEARDNLTGMLQTPHGRTGIKDVLGGIRLRSNELASFKQAFTRALVRSYKMINGATPTPRKDIRALLFGQEANADARYT